MEGVGGRTLFNSQDRYSQEQLWESLPPFLPKLYLPNIPTYLKSTFSKKSNIFRSLISGYDKICISTSQLSVALIYLAIEIILQGGFSQKVRSLNRSDYSCTKKWLLPFWVAGGKSGLSKCPDMNIHTVLLSYYRDCSLRT